MSIFSGLFKSRDHPTDSTVGSRYAFYMGGSSSGKSVTERSAMQMTAVYACVRILSEAIAGLPLHLYRYNGDGGKEIPDTENSVAAADECFAVAERESREGFPELVGGALRRGGGTGDERFAGRAAAGSGAGGFAALGFGG